MPEDIQRHLLMSLVITFNSLRSFRVPEALLARPWVKRGPPDAIVILFKLRTQD